jgi:hypothetical protein
MTILGKSAGITLKASNDNVMASAPFSIQARIDLQMNLIISACEQNSLLCDWPQLLRIMIHGISYRMPRRSTTQSLELL